MERKQFLRSLGAGAVFAIVLTCIHGCSKDGNGDVVPEDKWPIPSEIDFTINLGAHEGEVLQNNGGFILKEFVIVARNLEGQYVAAS